MYNGNSRLTQLPNGVMTEMVSTQTQLFYDPTTQSCRAIFNGQQFMQIEDLTDQSISYSQVGTNNDILHVTLNDKMFQVMTEPGDVDPVTGAALDNISVAGILLYMKRSYNRFHNARQAEIDAAIAQAEAAAAAMAAAAASETSGTEQGSSAPEEIVV